VSTRSNTHPGTAGLGLKLSLAGLLACLASSASAITLDEANQIDEGFRVFTQETFSGNGRTCSTCHIPTKGYTIGPRDIKRLKRKDRRLVFAANVPGLENPRLISRLGLFNTGPGSATGRAPVEGEANFRSSAAVRALELTTLNNFSVPGAPPSPTAEVKLGWAGDGSPVGSLHGIPVPEADGSIRAFANGAIAQHMTRSLNRVPGTDFRFATSEELDAMDAFQRWLGRRAAPPADPEIAPARFEFELADLKFRHKSVERGKRIFLSNEAGCHTCHTNGGANVNLELITPPGGFPDFVVGSNVMQKIGTGSQIELDRLSRRAKVRIPKDPGGAEPAGSFNLQSVIEAPRKHAFFHNSAVVGGVEDAARFYFRPPFGRTNGEPGTGASSREILDAISPGAFLDTERAFRAEFGRNGFNELGGFMRALSAYYSLVDCERLIDEAIERIEIGASPKLPINHCGINLYDARKVLFGAKYKRKPFFKTALKTRRLAYRIKVQARRDDIDGLIRSKETVAKLRRSIATTPQLQ
jgi:mono/diheme cytochrome c family protein